MRRSERTLLAVGLVLLVVVGWAASVPGQGVPASSVPMASEAEGVALRERATAFWAARLAGDFETQWQFLEPRWKGRITAAEYGSEGGAARYLAHQVEGITVNGFFATVNVRVLVQVVLPPSAAGRTRVSPRVTVVEDGWIRIGGVWFRRLEAGGIAPSQTGQQ